MIHIGSGRYQNVFRDGDIVLKIPINPLTPKEISQMIDYYKLLKSFGISVPRYLGVDDPNIGSTAWSFCGEPLTRVLQHTDRESINEYLSKIFDMSIKAYRNNAAFYPILEQFTFLDGVVYFVDFFPSRTKKVFNDYPDDKREVLGLMFYGLTPKIVRPSRQLLTRRPELRSSIELAVADFLRGVEMSDRVDSIIETLNFNIGDDIDNCRTFAGIKGGDVEYYDHILDIDPSNDWVIITPSMNVWPRTLFSQDLEKVKSLEIIKR